MTEDQTETEVKFYVFNLSQIEVSLRELKAHLFASRTFEVNLRFDTSNGDLQREGRVLRLRKDDFARLTYKDNSQQVEGALSRREIEFVVDDFDSAKQFIEALGYQVAFIYEKYRTTFEYQGVHIMLDELPYGNFLEIEGELELLRPIAEELRLNWDKAIPASYHALFERLCKSRDLTFRDLTFENFRQIKVSPADMVIEYADHEAIT
jgi:adenylate cyclase, class 2